jgi:dipeptidyl aminopeptidase/acylaminoacyl peptidase
MWANVHEGAEYGIDTAMAEKMGSVQALRAMSALYPELRKRGLRVLLMHGAVDDMVPPAQSIRLAKALSAAGATVELELVPGATHLWNGASDVSGIVRRSIDFLRARG